MIHNGSGNSKSSPNAVDNGLRENGWCNGWVNIADQLSRGLQNLNPACRVRFFFSTSVYGLTNYVIRHNIQIRKYVIITVLFLFERMHMHCKPMFWVPGPVPHMLGGTKNCKIYWYKKFSPAKSYIDLICSILVGFWPYIFIPQIPHKPVITSCEWTDH